MSLAAARVPREEILAALGMAPETFAKLESSGALAGDAEGLFDPLAVAAAAVRYGEERAAAADRRLAAVAAAISDVKPALERLAGLASRAELTGAEHDRAMVEVAAFFNAFAGAMTRATEALNADE